MNTQSQASAGEKFGVIFILAIFVGLGGWFGYLFDQIVELNTEPDPARRTISVLVGAGLFLTFLLIVMARSFKRSKRRVEASGGDSSNMSFFSMSHMSSDGYVDGGGHGGSLGGSGSYDGGGSTSGWGGGGSDSGGSSGGDGGGGGGGGGE